MPTEIKFPGGYKLPKEERILGGGNALINPMRKPPKNNMKKESNQKTKN